MQRKDVFFISALLLLSLLVYGNSLSNGFVLDDEPLIVDNPLIRSPHAAALAFKNPLYPAPFNKMYRPMQTLSYALECRMNGMRPWGFHLANILLHAFNACLVYYLLLVLFNRPTAAIAGLLFAIHPMNVSVVTYISGRADLLVVFFMLGSLCLFSRFLLHPSAKKGAGSLFLAALALLSKENALLLPLFILILLGTQKAGKKQYFWLFAFLALDGCYLGLRLAIFGPYGLFVHPDFLSMPLRLLNLANIIFRYLFLLVFPKDLRLMHTVDFLNHASLANGLLPAASLILFFYVFFRARKQKEAFFPVSWFFAGLIPVYFFLDAYRGISNQAMMAESWLYLPGVGFFAFIGFLASRWPLLKKGILFACIIYGFLTVSINPVWRDNLTIYRHIMKYLPDKNTVRKNIILEYLDRGLYDNAREELEKLCSHYPDTSLCHSLQQRYDLATGAPLSPLNSLP